MISLKGVLITPTLLLSDEGYFYIHRENFYTLGKQYYFLIDNAVFPWRIERALKVPMNV